MVHNLARAPKKPHHRSILPPPNTGAEILDQLHLSLSRFANNCNKIIMLAGDFNLPDIDWTIPTIKNKCRTPAMHSQLLNTLADHSLTQLNQTATRENNILDLITTNSPNLVNRIEILPGISDHHAIFTEVNTMPLVGKKTTQIHLPSQQNKYTRTQTTLQDICRQIRARIPDSNRG